ncbi:hypothetical protein [Kangiella sediminilitoris]|uniref:Uncharacterized protein n=1 Tax=Kangiella sediminilitoris TaxID=1144748 RepID=A0A1B3BCM2_9GAMM|nr:hypothetical protein [Kangiella sediminilitoris]AOE50564.1 hypothetical protein KS2013_1855 [Kangiella sediminilitoris]
MKKIIIPLVTIGILFILYTVFFQPSPSSKTKEQSAVATDSMDASGNDTVKTEPIDNKKPLKEVITTQESTKTNKKGLSCYQRYSSRPEWGGIQKIQEDISIDISYLYPEGNSYTNMPVESLKSFADSGDKDAMIFYGVELMQMAALGLSSLKRAELERQHRVEEVKEQRISHEPDLEQFNEGVEYIHRAAEEGKFAAFLEVQLYHRILAYQMKERSWDEEQINGSLATSHAYDLLQQEIMKSNALFVKMMSQEKALKRRIWRIYPKKENHDELLKEIQREGQLKFERLKEDWVRNRELKGQEVYPDLIGKDLESFTKAMIRDCYSD